jgi:NADH-quinone oxidoreductase subunit K
MIPLEHVLIFTALLLAAGLYGVLTRRNVIGILIAVELMLNAAALNFVAFSRYGTAPEAGQIFAFFIVALAAAGAATGLAIVLALYRIRKTVQAEEIDLLKW